MLKDYLKVAYVFITLLMILMYLGALYDKLKRPNFKNMNDSESVWLGMIALVLLVIDLKIIKNWIDKTS